MTANSVRATAPNAAGGAASPACSAAEPRPARGRPARPDGAQERRLAGGAAAGGERAAEGTGAVRSQRRRLVNPDNQNANPRSPMSTRFRCPPRAWSILALLAVACLGLAACGSSSKTSSAAAAAAGTGVGGAGAGGARNGARFAQLRACLQKDGINLPPRTPGARRPPGGGFFGGGGTGGPPLPAGVTRAQYRAALKKCGGGTRFGQRRAITPAFRQAVTAYAACMRQNGINLPAPNTSGNGPVSAPAQSTATPRSSPPPTRSARASCAAPSPVAGRGPQAPAPPPAEVEPRRSRAPAAPEVRRPAGPASATTCAARGVRRGARARG